METNLTLTANRWQLAAHLLRSGVHGEVMMVKNVTSGTYLRVNRKQWQVLEKFTEPRTVPSVLQQIMEDRSCPALGEFYELVLKAVRAHILIEPKQLVKRETVANWPVSVTPSIISKMLVVIFAVSCAVVLWVPPPIPEEPSQVLAGLGWWLLGSGLGAALAASVLRGGGGEVYVRKGIFIRTKDSCMLAPADQRGVAMASLAIVAFTTAALAWYRPMWGFVPMLALLGQMRPFLHGTVTRMIAVSIKKRMSDAEHDFIFPPNRTALRRARLLKRVLSSPVTWLQLGYGVAWTLAASYVVGASAAVPPWEPEFWRENGLVIVGSVVGSLALLGLVYLTSEGYLFLRARAVARHDTIRQWWRRWLGSERFENEEIDRLRAVLRSPLLRLLSPPAQQTLAQVMTAQFVWPWKTLHDFEEPVERVSLIRSGKVGVYRRLPGGRRELLQVLCENDMVGLHAIADPNHPVFHYRTLTPVVLLQIPMAEAGKMILSQLGPIDLANPVMKFPFLSRISLCQNWHVQAIQRFAELSRMIDYKEGEPILTHGFYSESFFILFEGEASIISSKGKQLGRLRSSDFFGEIGLLQNSNATAHVIAGRDTRCLSIPRVEFFRFVTHNYTVALELESVSSRRLGRPIFPLHAGNFEQLSAR